MTLFATLMALAATWGLLVAQLLTKGIESRLVGRLATRIEEKIVEGYSAAWRDLCSWYSDILRNVGVDSVLLEPREARAALARTEQSLLSRGPLSPQSHAILDNARRSIPPGIEINRPLGALRALLILVGSIVIYNTIPPSNSKWVFGGIVLVGLALIPTTVELAMLLRVLLAMKRAPR